MVLGLRISDIARMWSFHPDHHSSSSQSIDGRSQALLKMANGSSGDFGQPPVSFRESPHLVRVKDGIVYASSSLSCLFLPIIVKTDVWIETCCPTTGTAIVLKVTQAGVSKCEPPESVLSLVLAHELHGEQAEYGLPATSSANHLMRFFSSEVAAMSWLIAYRHATVLSMDDAWRLAVLVHRNNEDEFG
jgi:hypothetical protein